MIAIIGGTGIANILRGDKEEIIETKYGKAKIMRDKDLDVILLFRHGVEHNIPPHKINYRANIYALKKLGVERILAINSVGSMKEHIKPGMFFIPIDFVEFTKKREETFYDYGKVVHIDLSEPYCPELREVLENILNKNNFEYEKGVYVCTEGPRFETKREIEIYRKFGDVVGMTGYPEVVLARELEMCYVSLCNVTNYACGLQKCLTVKEVLDILKEMEERILKVVEEFIKYNFKERNCICKDALKYAVIE
ncbi:purine phosphorylase family 2 [Methanocaldococcus villosus KIN24-T80]|uniref:Probable S-methyl-5'-thioinosine phosphorylase n=1 Tax=Methanocaldococcus villosus KIN24-T80 TaxID=1069083 RepID=N6VPM1_9EURY|nr:MTAP family purine nucleoside phosphorylase [Methanocaldococcus villosus]ENN95845.1 purine phosphorylase family 2 [Methanocaldococcus villosus KIN24-T80]